MGAPVNIFTPQKSLEAEDIALAVAAEDVIAAVAAKLASWRDDPADEAGEMAREFIDLLNTWTKREVIEAYSAGVISDTDVERIFRENGLRFL